MLCLSIKGILARLILLEAAVENIAILAANVLKLFFSFSLKEYFSGVTTLKRTTHSAIILSIMTLNIIAA